MIINKIIILNYYLNSKKFGSSKLVNEIVNNIKKSMQNRSIKENISRQNHEISRQNQEISRQNNDPAYFDYGDEPYDPSKPLDLPGNQNLPGNANMPSNTSLPSNQSLPGNQMTQPPPNFIPNNFPVGIPPAFAPPPSNGYYPFTMFHPPPNFVATQPPPPQGGVFPLQQGNFPPPQLPPQQQQGIPHQNINQPLPLVSFWYF